MQLEDIVSIITCARWTEGPTAAVATATNEVGTPSCGGAMLIFAGAVARTALMQASAAKERFHRALKSANGRTQSATFHSVSLAGHSNLMRVK